MRINRRWMYSLIGLCLLLSLLGGLVTAQESSVTDDQVNAVAKKLYCPVCENIPLDACGTEACLDWRYEIRLQLEDGRTEQEIVADFVTRFGDRVVGTPQDPTLRTISLVTPWIITILAALAVLYLLVQWRRSPGPETEALSADHAALDDYQTLLEDDLAG